MSSMDRNERQQKKESDGLDKLSIRIYGWKSKKQKEAPSRSGGYLKGAGLGSYIPGLIESYS
jgi:hypothetical protein